MEEVDGIILPILHQIGVKFPGKEEVTSVAQFEADHIYLAASAICTAINAANQFPPQLPDAKAARFRVCTSLSKVIEDMGWTAELGYNAFLYPNVADMRKLLVWLVDKLPKVSQEEEEQEVAGVQAGTQQRIADAMRSWTAARWSIFHRGTQGQSDGVSTRRLCVGAHALDPTAEEKAYVKELQRPVSAQVPATIKQVLAASVFEYNAKEVVLAQERERDWASQGANSKAKRTEALNALVGEAFQLGVAGRGKRGSMSSLSVEEMAAAMLAAYGKGGSGAFSATSAFNRRTDFGQEKEGGEVTMVGDDGAATKLVVEEENKKDEAKEEEAVRLAREEELAELQKQLNKYKQLLSKMEDLSAQNQSASRQIQAQIDEKLEETRKLEEAYVVKKRVLDLLPNADENLKKLQAISEASAGRLLELAMQWEEHRGPLIAKYRRRKQGIEDRKNEVGVKIDQIKRMRQEMKDKAKELREKDEIHKQVLDELNKMPKSINRQVYVRRIMDIMKNLDRQKVDIKKVLEDIRQIQKDINTVSESSKRSFSMADEIIFQAAKADKSQKKDPTATEAYKGVVRLRDGFVALVESVENTGRTKNDIRDISSQIEALEGRKTEQNMERVEADLSQVKKENKDMAKQIKAKGGDAPAEDE